MKIGIDCFKLIKGQGKSIGIYNVAKFIVQGMARDPQGHEIIVFGNEWNKHDFAVAGVTFISVSYDAKNKVACIKWELFGVNRFISECGPDIMLYPRGYMPLRHKTPSAVIVHDLIPFYYHKYYPGTFNRLENFYIMNRLKASIKTADKVITISDYSKDQIVELVPRAEHKLFVIENGVAAMEHSEKSELSKGYMLGVTSKLPHKNAVDIINSYVKFCETYGALLDLVLVGLESLDGISVDVPEEIAKNIQFKKFLKDEEYLNLFSNANVLLFLSKIEGFGLPPLEAMQLDVPVIVSNKSCLPDVVKDAGIIVEPNNYADIADNIYGLYSDHSRRNTMIQKGRERVKAFQWEDKIKEYFKVLEN